MTWEIVRELAAEGTTLLLTTQYLDEADQLARRVAVIDGGAVIAEGTPDQLKSSVGGEHLDGGPGRGLGRRGGDHRGQAVRHGAASSRTRTDDGCPCRWRRPRG